MTQPAIWHARIPKAREVTGPIVLLAHQGSTLHKRTNTEEEEARRAREEAEAAAELARETALEETTKTKEEAEAEVEEISKALEDARVELRGPSHVAAQQRRVCSWSLARRP